MSTPDTPPAAPDLEQHLTSFWERHNRTLVAVCTLILLGIVAKEGWAYFAAQREAGIRKEYAAATTPAMERAFAAAHPDDALTGVVQLQVADAAYADNQMTEAITAYTQAVAILKTGPLVARAQLGLAMAQIQSGQAPEGTATLQQLAEDPKGFTAVRTEATYQLASLAATAGRTAEVQRLAAQLLQIDPNSSWAQRAFALQARPSAAASPAGPAPTSAPAVSFKSGTP